jgi:Transposase DDE domain
VAAVQAGRLVDAGAIGRRVGRVDGKSKMAKHFVLAIAPGSFAYSRDEPSIAAEAALDGIYVLRTSLPADRADAAQVVTTYKSLAGVERDFRSLKTIDLDLRPIRHYTERRVRGHVFLCMLAAYLVWHLRAAWAPLTFTDQAPPIPTDPVAPARRSEAAERKAATQHTDDQLPARSFADLLSHLATLTRNDMHVAGTPDDQTFQLLTVSTPSQQRAFDLIHTPIPLRLR